METEACTRCHREIPPKFHLLSCLHVGDAVEFVVLIESQLDVSIVQCLGANGPSGFVLGPRDFEYGGG